MADDPIGNELDRLRYLIDNSSGIALERRGMIEALDRIAALVTPAPAIDPELLGQAMVATGFWPRGYQAMRKKWPTLVAAEYDRLMKGREEGGVGDV